MSTQNVFETLNAINVNDYTELKDTGRAKLTYLSWSKAWEEVKKRFPAATYEIRRFGFQSLPYVYDENTGYMVFTTVTSEGITHEMWLPVMDGKNKAMKANPYDYKTRNGVGHVDAATMFDINTAIMRCLTKNLAMFGLGLYIYNGEDIPNMEKDENLTKPVDKAHIKTLKKEMERTGVSEKRLLYNIGCQSMETITIKSFERAMELFKNTPDKEVSA